MTLITQCKKALNRLTEVRTLVKESHSVEVRVNLERSNMPFAADMYLDLDLEYFLCPIKLLNKKEGGSHLQTLHCKAHRAFMDCAINTISYFSSVYLNQLVSTFSAPSAYKLLLVFSDIIQQSNSRQPAPAHQRLLSID